MSDSDCFFFKEVKTILIQEFVETTRRLITYPKYSRIQPAKVSKIVSKSVAISVDVRTLCNTNSLTMIENVMTKRVQVLSDSDCRLNALHLSVKIPTAEMPNSCFRVCLAKVGMIEI